MSDVRNIAARVSLRALGAREARKNAAAQAAAGLILLVRAFEPIGPLKGVYLVLSYPISWVVGFLSPSPNGMGVREGILKVLLGGFYDNDLLLLITLTSRIWTIFGEILSFLLFKGLYLFYRLRGGEYAGKISK